MGNRLDLNFWMINGTAEVKKPACPCVWAAIHVHVQNSDRRHFADFRGFCVSFLKQVLVSDQPFSSSSSSSSSFLFLRDNAA